MTYATYMTYITYMTYKNHNYISCVGYKNTHFIKSQFEKVNFMKCIKNIKHFL